MDGEILQFFRQSSMWSDKWEKLILNLFENQNGYLKIQPCVVKENEEIVSGCLLLSFDGLMTLFHLFTKPEKRNQGYAYKVISKAIDIFKKSSDAQLLTARTVEDYFVCDLFLSAGFKRAYLTKSKSPVILWHKK